MRLFASSHGAEDKAPSAFQQLFIDKEDTFGAHNYHPLPVVLKKGEGCFLWDTDNKRYFDFLRSAQLGL